MTTFQIILGGFWTVGLKGAHWNGGFEARVLDSPTSFVPSPLLGLDLQVRNHDGVAVTVTLGESLRHTSPPSFGLAIEGAAEVGVLLRREMPRLRVGAQLTGGYYMGGPVTWVALENDLGGPGPNPADLRFGGGWQMLTVYYQD